MNNDAQFTDKRLASLQEPEGFEPSAAQARIMLEARTSPSAGRWIWKVALVVPLLLLFFALPAARAVAQTGTLSPEAFGHSLHETLRDVHLFIYHLFN